MFMYPGWSPVDLLFLVVGALVWASVIVGVFAGGAKRLDYGGRWLGAYGLDPGAEGRAFADYFTRSNLLLRVTGGAAGLTIGAVFDRAFGIDTSAHFGFWAWIMAGWMTGSWWADRSIERPGERGAAALIARSLPDYVSWQLLLAPSAMAGVVVIEALVSRRMSVPTGGGVPLTEPITGVGVGLAALVSVGVAAITFLMQRSVVSRHQPLATSDLRQVDDAARATTMHHIGGAATAVNACIAGYLLHVGLLLTPRLPLGLRGWLPLVPVLIAFVAWRFWAFVPRPVTRPEAIS